MSGVAPKDGGYSVASVLAAADDDALHVRADEVTMLRWARNNNVPLPDKGRLRAINAARQEMGLPTFQLILRAPGKPSMEVLAAMAKAVNEPQVYVPTSYMPEVGSPSRGRPRTTDLPETKTAEALRFASGVGAIHISELPPKVTIGTDKGSLTLKDTLFDPTTAKTLAAERAASPFVPGRPASPKATLTLRGIAEALMADFAAVRGSRDLMDRAKATCAIADSFAALVQAEAEILALVVHTARAPHRARLLEMVGAEKESVGP